MESLGLIKLTATRNFVWKDKIIYKVMEEFGDVVRLLEETTIQVDEDGEESEVAITIEEVFPIGPAPPANQSAERTIWTEMVKGITKSRNDAKSANTRVLAFCCGRWMTRWRCASDVNETWDC